MKIVKCKYCEGMNFSWNLNLFSGPKFYIECGSCGVGFYSRLPLASYPKIGCPNCGTVNEIPIEYS